MPGTPSGENHSSESQACGLKLMPRPFSSAYRRRMGRARRESSTVRFRSQSLTFSNSSSRSLTQARARRGMAGLREFALGGMPPSLSSGHPGRDELGLLVGFGDAGPASGPGALLPGPVQLLQGILAASPPL